jgi:hypothetical protein
MKNNQMIRKKFSGKNNFPLMQEHHLQSQISKHGSKDMTYQHDRISNQHLTQKHNELLRYFGNNIFKYILFVKSYTTVRSCR